MPATLYVICKFGEGIMQEEYEVRTMVPPAHLSLLKTLFDAGCRPQPYHI